MKFDKKHSLFWMDGQNKFFVLKVEDKDAFIISVFDNDTPHHIFFSSDDFSSLICEILKYCLDLPKVARSVPCPTDITKKFHGCLKAQKTEILPDGTLCLHFDDRWLEYHGYPKEVSVITRDGGVVIIKPSNKV